ncbi:penicillin-binding transpeptidase domain-containing protein [Nonomuraea sp. NPDC003804]|uniref:penicillin-binding transpeptidase domain-containing protein n=1 Tax=Nonomuraea sp. NPDC003804 TaxID=3154547 RepID=UPI0033B5B0CD
MHELSNLRSERRRRRRWPLVTAGLLVPLLVGGGVIWVTRTAGSPEETAESFLAAWSRRDYPAMQALVHAPPPDFAKTYQSFFKELRITSAAFEVGEDVKELEEGRVVPFTARLKGAVDWTYQGRLHVGEWDGTWQVDWSSTSVHPELGRGAVFKLEVSDPETAAISAADGRRIDGTDAPGSVQQLVDGLKQTYKDRLTGSSSTRLDLYRDGRRVETVAEKGATEGTPLKTTIDLRVHRAGAEALDGVTKPASLVALRPSTGEILAAVNKPGGFNRALLGKYPPGSTFKVVTASALVADGVAPDKTVKCPPEQNIGGFPFHNAGFHDYGTLSFRNAFAHSCNTTFGAMAVSSLKGGRLGEVAAGFGFGAPIMPGVPAVRAEYPEPKDDTDLASAAIGQGRVLASPLNMAAVAAAIANGTWRPPRLVPADLVPPGGSGPRKLEPEVVRALRDLMPAVVSEGTAHAVRFPAGSAGKTGTAEYGSGKEPPAHSWFVGYHGDLAFAVIVEGAGAGAAVAAPVAARFLQNLDRSG